MKTALKQQGIRVAKKPELALVRALAPERRYARRWLWRVRALAQRLRYLLFCGPGLVRTVAPEEPVLQEYQWRQWREPKLGG